VIEAADENSRLSTLGTLTTPVIVTRSAVEDPEFSLTSQADNNRPADKRKPRQIWDGFCNLIM
jgi:hypothetical protein